MTPTTRDVKKETAMFYCMAEGHAHKTREEEVECSARFQITALRTRAEEAERKLAVAMAAKRTWKNRALGVESFSVVELSLDDHRALRERAERLEAAGKRMVEASASNDPSEWAEAVDQLDRALLTESVEPREAKDAR